MSQGDKMVTFKMLPVYLEWIHILQTLLLNVDPPYVNWDMEHPSNDRTITILKI